MSDAEVPSWRGVKTFFPEMTLQVHAPAPAVLEVLAGALAEERFKIKDARADGFKARYVSWFDVAAGTFNRTSLDLEVAHDGEATRVLISATSSGEHLSGQAHASRGLSAAVRRLRADGRVVATTPWVVPEERRKGKRR